MSLNYRYTESEVKQSVFTTCGTERDLLSLHVNAKDGSLFLGDSKSQALDRLHRLTLRLDEV